MFKKQIIFLTIAIVFAGVAAIIPHMSNAAISFTIDQNPPVSNDSVVFKGSYAGSSQNSQTTIYMMYAEKNTSGACEFFSQTGSQTFTTIAADFSFPLNNLKTNTSYCFKGILTNQTSGRMESSVYTFTTTNTQTGGTASGNLVSVRTLGALMVKNTSARIGAETTSSGPIAIGFEYGTAVNSLSMKIPEVLAKSPSDSISQELTNLTPNTTYYYKAVGRGANTTLSGQVLSFKTGTTGDIVSQNDPTVDQSDEQNTKEIAGNFEEGDELENPEYNSKLGFTDNIFEKEASQPKTSTRRPVATTASRPTQRIAYTYVPPVTQTVAPLPTTALPLAAPLIVTPEPIKPAQVAFQSTQYNNPNALKSKTFDANTRGAAAALFGVTGIPGVFTLFIVIALIVGIILVIRFIMLDVQNNQKNNNLNL